MIERIRRAFASGATIEIVVTDCVYTCCSRQIPRLGYEQKYTGFVLSVGESGFVLEKPGIGTYTYRITAQYDGLISVDSDTLMPERGSAA